MYHPQRKLSGDVKIIFQQQIIIFMDAACQGIFYGDDAIIGPALFYRFKDIPERGHGITVHIFIEVMLGGLVAEGALLSKVGHPPVRAIHQFPGVFLFFSSSGIVVVQLLAHHRCDDIQIPDKPAKLNGIKALGSIGQGLIWIVMHFNHQGIGACGNGGPCHGGHLFPDAGGMAGINDHRQVGELL